MRSKVIYDEESSEMIELALLKIVVGVKLSIKNSKNIQPSLDSYRYNELVSEEVVRLIADDLENGCEETEWWDLISDPFKLGTLLEMVRETSIEPYSDRINEDNTHRKLSGMYFTPKEIVDFIVGRVVSNWLSDFEQVANDTCSLTDFWFNLKIIDPACGTGSFLIAVGNKLMEKYDDFYLSQNHGLPKPPVFRRHLVTHILHGIDVDPLAVRLCAANIRYHMSVDPSTEINILTGDAITGTISTPLSSNDFGSNWAKPICYQKSFPNVFNKERNGFDIVLMNPPYGKLRAEMGKGIRKGVYEDETEKTRFEQLRSHIRSSGMYPNSRGVLNWYKLFIERAISISEKHSILGFIVPATLLCDRSTSYLRTLILSHNLTDLIHIPENNEFFTGVTQSFSVCILSKNTEYTGTDFKIRVNSLSDATAKKSIDLRFICKKSNDTFSIPLTTTEGLNIISKMHMFPKLTDISSILNLRGELDLTTFKDCFQDFSEGGFRLLRGSDIGTYSVNQSPRTSAGFVNKELAISKMGGSRKKQHLFRNRIACQQIANQESLDRLKFARIPSCHFLGNSLNYIVWTGENEEIWLDVLLGVLNSTLLDWRFKVTSTNNHINNYEIDELPIPINNINSTILNSKLREIASLAQQMSSNPNGDSYSLMNLLDVEVFSLFRLNYDEISFVLHEVGENEKRITEILEMVRND